MKPVVWQAVRWTATEFFTLNENGHTKLATGDITGVIRDQPFSIHYEVEIAPNWHTSSFLIRSSGPAARELKLTSDLGGHWFDKDNNYIAAFDGCIDIDISLTPFTNTLPVQRLQALPNDGEAMIDVIYILLPEFELQKTQQRYTRLRADTWRYDNVTTPFTADLTFDEYGIMKDYPGLLQRRY
ncbi:putative glycolipid-binding domain-containing protein [Chitinophaga vietnamensis]|uniref:putative glycolipid-binding domain-containing protein n=1 Tax=Chitinophaga vietnamensis TaxID=2593957 RepID=UPI001177BC27|nr:putative glycolipid-binding domain-containing protein [Chitinophaga vietnamensis]